MNFTIYIVHYAFHTMHFTLSILHSLCHPLHSTPLISTLFILHYEFQNVHLKKITLPFIQYISHIFYHYEFQTTNFILYILHYAFYSLHSMHSIHSIHCIHPMHSTHYIHSINSINASEVCWKYHDFELRALSECVSAWVIFVIFEHLKRLRLKTGKHI